MKKELKKCYHCLDLPYSATAEEIKAREVALVKVYQSKAREKKIDVDKDIELIEKSSETLIENIKTNGMPKVKKHVFESSGASIVWLCVLLGFAVFMCYSSFTLL